MGSELAKVMARGWFNSEGGEPDEWLMHSDEVRAEYLKHAQAALSALDAAGFSVVPKEPTEAMLTACWPLHHPWGPNAPAPEERPGLFSEMKDGKRLDWSAMLKAARPQP